MNLYGLKIVSSPLCHRTETTFSVKRHPTRKRRKNWRVVATTKTVPVAYRVGNTLFVHPQILKELENMKCNYLQN